LQESRKHHGAALRLSSRRLQVGRRNGGLEDKMKRWSATLLAVAVCSAVVHADVTIVQKTTVEGGPAAMTGGSIPTPTMTSRIKGSKGRIDIDLAGAPMAVNMSTITAAVAKEVILLDHAQKTARVSLHGAPAGAPPPQVTVKLDASVNPTGKSQTIDGLKCDEFTFTTSMNLSDVGGAQVPPEAAAAMQGITMMMKGSLWVAKDAPGAGEYRAFQKAMASADLASAAMGATGVSMPGMDKLAKAMMGVEGVPVLTEMTMTVEGGTGQMADMMKQMMGDMKVTTKVLSLKTDALSDDIFKVPEGYQIIK
jgi:hypothetical protein